MLHSDAGSGIFLGNDRPVPGAHVGPEFTLDASRVASPSKSLGASWVSGRSAHSLAHVHASSVKQAPC